MLKERKDYIDYLKAIASVFVVLHHSIGRTNLRETNIFLQAIYVSITQIHVPLFFCIAGYLCHKSNIKPYLSKKIQRIFIPFIVFSVLKLIYSAFISDEYAHANSLLPHIYDAFVLGELYWFAYAILLMFAAAPLLWKMQRGNIILFICLLVLNVILEKTGLPIPNVLQIKRTISHFCFFVAGIILQQNEISIQKILSKFKALIFALCLTSIISILYLRLKNIISMTYIIKITFSFSYMFILYVLVRLLPNNIALLKIAGKYSLQIMFFDSFYRVVLFAILPPTNSLLLFLVVILNVIISCLSCCIIEKIPYVKKLFGL